MENTNVVVNEVVENANELEVVEVTACPTKQCCMKKAGVVALGIVATVVAVKLTKKLWKKVIKPAIKNHKEKKAAKAEVIDVEATVVEE